MTWLVVQRIAKQRAHLPDLLLRQRVRLRSILTNSHALKPQRMSFWNDGSVPTYDRADHERAGFRGLKCTARVRAPENRANATQFGAPTYAAGRAAQLPR
jgi:hypothetical protein